MSPSLLKDAKESLPDSSREKVRLWPGRKAQIPGLLLGAHADPGVGDGDVQEFGNGFGRNKYLPIIAEFLCIFKEADNGLPMEPPLPADRRGDGAG